MTEYITVSHETIGGALLERQLGPLERFITLFGFELDGIHSEYDALLHVNDPMAVPASTLPYVAADLGFPYEGSLGDTRVRYLLARLLQLRKQKGTLPGLEGFVTAITGYPTEARVGTNLLLGIDDSDFRTSAGTWHSGTSVAERVTDVVPGARSAIPGAPYLRIHPSVAANSFAAGTGLIPIPSHKANRPGTYTVSGWVAGVGPFPLYSGATAYVPGDRVTYDLGLGDGPQHFIATANSTGNAPPDTSKWAWYWNGSAFAGAGYYNQRGKVMSGAGTTPVAAPVTASTATLDQTWTHISFSFDPPDGVAFIAPSFGLGISGGTGLPTTTYLYVSEPTLTYSEAPLGADVVFESARKIHLFCSPARVNMLQNPSVQDGLGSGGLGNGQWYPYAGGTGVLAYDFNHGIDGDGALKVRIDADGAFVGAQAATGLSELAEVDETYTGSAYVYCPPGVSVELVLEFTDTLGISSDVVLPPTGTTYSTGVITPAPNVYVPLEVSGVADAERALFTVKFYGNDAMIGYMDQAMVEKAPNRQPYFDGDTPSTYGEYGWESTPHSSASTFHLHKSIREAVLARHLPEWIPGETDYDVTYTAAP